LQTNKTAQFLVGFFLCLLLLLFWGFLMKMAESSVWYYGLLPLFLSFAQFSLTPMLRSIGIYRYYSDFLLVYNPKKTKYELHAGTSFDYWLHLRWNDKGAKSRNYIFGQMVLGLLNIIKEVEQGILPDKLKIVATSYFFSERSIRRLGFESKKASLFNRINLLVNFLDIFWMYSFSQNKLSMPNLFKANKFEISAHDLVLQKEKLTHILIQMEERMQTMLLSK
jgi:hypothetical protein